MHRPERPFDILIVHSERHSIIALRYPVATRLVWRKLAAKTLAFIRLPKVRNVMNKNAALTNDSILGQVALDRLASDRPAPYLSPNEAHCVMNLILPALLYWETTGRRWKMSRAFLILMADITPYLLNPLAPARAWGDTDPRDSAVECYEQLRIVIGNTPSWLSLDAIYVFWFELKNYQGKNKGIHELEKRLNALSKPYRLALKRIKPNP